MQEAAQLDPEVAAFAADQERTFSADFYARPIAEQRARYDAFWRRFDAPMPREVTARNVPLALPDRTVAMRLYRPEQAPGRLPAIVYFHGGSWMFGGLDSHEMATARLAAVAQCAVLAVDYRLAPEHKYPDGLEDGWEALRFAVERGAGLGLDPTRVAVAGDSAGGALAAGLALMARDRGGPMLRAQGLIYPALRPNRDETVPMSPGLDQDAVADALAGYFRRPEDARDPYAMPLLARDFADLPPAVICGAELDVLLPDARDFDAALQRAGVPSRLIVGRGLPHTFLRVLHVSREAARAFEAFGTEMARFLRA